MERMTESAPPLRFTEAADVYDKLKSLKRTGWVQWDIPNPETVYEHTVSVRELAISYQAGLGLSDQELTELLDMLEVHDWPEALVGDAVILGDEENVEALRMTKQQRELVAMREICKEMPEGQKILLLYERYAAGSDHIAKLAKQIEKLQAVIVAEEYQKQYKKNGLLAEFVYYTKDLIHHSFLRGEFQKVATSVSLFLLYVALPTQHYAQAILKLASVSTIVTISSVARI